ncbi:MAG: methyltransferase domain-containing protein [Nitrospira sp.]|nr:MAG: methyltransferase domain-containing protein [Nitrospira sp.]
MDGLSDRVTEYFARPDAATQWWKITTETKGRYGRQLAFLSKHVALSGIRVLDVATGQGRFAIHAARSGAAKVVAVDISSAMIGQAREHAKRHGVENAIDFLTGNAADLKLAGESFDLITFMEVLVHVPRPASILANLSRLLAPDGCLLTNFDFPAAQDITYPIDWLHSLMRGVLKGKGAGDLIMHETVDQAIAKLREGADTQRVIMRPRDAYRGLASTDVYDWIRGAGLRVHVHKKEYPRVLGRVPIPTPIGMILLCQKCEGFEEGKK